MLSLDFETGTQAALKSARASLLADPLGSSLRSAIEKSSPPWQPRDVDERVHEPPFALNRIAAAASCCVGPIMHWFRLLSCLSGTRWP